MLASLKDGDVKYVISFDESLNRTQQEQMDVIICSLIRLLSLFEYMLDESGTAENKVELLFSHDKLSLASILRPLHQVTEEMLV